MFANGPSLLIDIIFAPNSEISFQESLNVQSSISQTGELAATMNDNTIFPPLNSSKVRNFNSVSGSSNPGAVSPMLSDIIVILHYPIKFFTKYFFKKTDLKRNHTFLYKNQGEKLNWSGN